MLAASECIVLDGGVATEIERRALPEGVNLYPRDMWAVKNRPQAVLEAHRAYLDAGATVMSTDTWSVLSAPTVDTVSTGSKQDPYHWMDAARRGIQLARRAVAERGKESDCAVAFAISEEIDSADRRLTVDLLGHIFEDDPPDLILLETLTLIRDPDTFDVVELLLESGYPVWVSFRRCRHGVCGVHGQHWGPPEGDLFGRAAVRFEQMGVGALLINCLPIEHVPGMVSWLRDFTDLPLGVYPNLGHLSGDRWHFDDATTPDDFAELAVAWRSEGAQLIGGCCGVMPEHIAAAFGALQGTTPGRQRPISRDPEQGDSPPGNVEPWSDARGQAMSPLPFPDIQIERGVFVPTEGSFLAWKTLFKDDVGRDNRCLDVGCGCGILSVQLALNHALSVHAIDIDQRAVTNALANAFRNGVSDRVTGEAVDLYHWHPNEHYDVVVASLFQMPVDPYEEPAGHRPLDYWGRNLIDHFIRMLPKLLAPGGVAYLMQLSIVGQHETTRLLAENGLTAEVVDFSFFPFGKAFEPNRGQICRVEELSDAYHLQFNDSDVMVAYLLEIRRDNG